ncbi:uncharacterized protein LOC110848267 [Folsomia candida]|nr:uncharacterized protein LOC110848267 [Folsomia candida]
MLTVLSSFENPKYVLIWLEGGEIIAKLPRHNISLRYHSDLGIICQEYNMVVMADYDLQTLSGLRQALVLEELNAQQRGMKLRKVLVPHGNIEVQYGGRITINTTELRNPPSLVIDVDEVLKVLTAGPYTYAWLYLAALHAVTTSPMRDSFTGQTGLERAVQILSSGRCRSSSPYDDESLVTIKFLCGLYPTRKIQEDKISRRLRNKPIEQIKVKFERVAFPKHLSAYAAYEGYYFILKALLQESNSLNFLFPTTKRLESSVELNNVDENLMARSYWRRIRFYNPAAAIPFEFMPASYNAPNPAVNFESAHLLQMDKRAYHLRVLAALCSSRKFTSANPDRVRTLIYRSEHLEGLKPTAVDDLLDLYKDLRPHWIQLYQKAITQPWEEWTLTVCEIGYKSVLDLADLLILQTIAANRLKFPKAPIIPEYKNINEIEFNSARVATILKDRKTGFSEYNNSSIWSTIGNVNSKDVPDKKQFEDSAAWEAAQAAYISEAIKKIELAWIAWSGAKRSNKSTSDATEIFSEISRTISSSIFFQRRNYYSSIIESSHDKIAMLLCEVFQTWEDNYALKLFVEAVETRLSTCGGYKDFDQIGTLVMPESSEFVRLMGKLVLCRGEIRARSWSKLRIIRMPKITKNTSHTTESVYQSLNSLITAMWKNLEDCYKEDDVLVFPADLSERLVPSRLFPKLLEQLPPDLNQFLLHLARKTRHFQRLFRILSYKRDEKKAYLYKNEKLNKPETNWTSEEFPEWLLLELELNLTIRGIQARIAKHMMDLNSGGSKVTQLNMGEGKTSVILPMVISRLAKAKEKCVRVTVLKSLFQTNYQQLKHALGSLLGQMVYSIPCDRNSTLETDQVEAVLALQKDILKRKGVIVTVPEYRLSWELRAYESYGNPIFCRSLINLFSWNEVNCQDILDESDEILSARYQKVYAMGASSKISEIRWKTCQKILKWIPNILRKLSRDARFTDCVEIDDNIGTKNKYPRCRLLNYTTQSDLCYDTFSAIITTDFIELELPHLPEDLRADIKKYLTDSSITSDLYYRLESEELLKPKFALIQAVAELLSHPGIFKCALNKRWRVNYGVSGKNSRMAVPFKAKDVAFDKTEFGHPAMGIVLTQLSYYYSGLTEQQVDVCLDVLEKRENPVVEFNEWLAFCDNLDISYQSLNRAFPPQRVRLYPALMYNTVVIDFYLTHCVFPKELKCYPGKITTTAWDLCYSEGNNVAGFSGTNDAQLLLPMHIKQDDLVELQDTNEQVRKAVEQSEDYCALESWIPEGTHILEMIAKKRIKILIDAGALMIDMDNSKVADVMLELDYSLEGVVFFNEDNKLIVRSRKGKDADCDFVSSPLRESLADKCAIYIDDEHTRGTDFKFPVGAVGCVTLGGRLPRDKLVQACMRMRMLQSGEHKVSFIATKDVDNQIKSLLATNPDCDPTRSITASDVMTWVIKNSEEYEKEGLIFYSNNALNFAKKRAGLLNLQSYEDFSRFGREITDQEKGGERNEEFASEEIFAKIISHCFESARWPLVENSLACDKITALFEEVKGHIVTLVTDKIPNRTCFSTNLEEQQEREIELEREVQVQIARPVVQHPWPHGLDRNVRNFVVEKHFVDSGEGIVELQVPSIFATRDFIRVVQHGEILRPVNWVVSRSEGGILILSPYEVNELLPYFWRGEVNSNLDMFSARVKNLGDILINVSSLQLGQRLGGKIEGDTLSRLHLYGGSLYFEDNEAAWVKKLIKELNGKFNIVKNVEKRLQYFPENCDLRKFTNC